MKCAGFTDYFCMLQMFPLFSLIFSFRCVCQSCLGNPWPSSRTAGSRACKRRRPPSAWCSPPPPGPRTAWKWLKEKQVVKSQQRARQKKWAKAFAIYEWKRPQLKSSKMLSTNFPEYFENICEILLKRSALNSHFLGLALPCSIVSWPVLSSSPDIVL